jgi:hypothetical protein
MMGSTKPRLIRDFAFVRATIGRGVIRRKE